VVQETHAGSSAAPRVLVVEDDTSIRELLALHLGLEGFSCTTLDDGREALRRLQQEPFDLLVLDLMLPGVDGITLCRAVRRDGPNKDALILMLTARREESDKVLGLESGADDYLAKPFGIREFLARVAALLRRRRTAADADATGEVITVHDIEIVPARHRVVVRGEPVELTRQEFGLLQVLASNPGIVFSREALLSRVWRDDTYVTDRSVDALVKRLRRKIEQDPANPALLLTVWGTGYKMADV
jgi:two-component system OmpR family response regulator/two-component system alkaline phosphatase synthesis response regulator PhoP